METNPPRNSQPETHPDGFLVLLRRQVCFELHRRHVTQRRMQALAVVDPLQKLTDRGACLRQVPVLAAIDLFVLQGLQKRLAGGVVLRIALAGHADLDSLALEQVGVVAAGIWNAAIGMVHQARPNAAPGKRHP